MADGLGSLTREQKVAKLEAGIEFAQWLLDYFNFRYFLTAVLNWNQGMHGANHGQWVIFFTYIEPALQLYFDAAFVDFPFVDPGDYVDTAYDSYDSDVMYRAFSDTIEAPVPDMEGIVERAQAIYEIMLIMEELLALLAL